MYYFFEKLRFLTTKLLLLFFFFKQIYIQIVTKKIEIINVFMCIIRYILMHYIVQ